MTAGRRPLRTLLRSNPELGRLFAAHAISRAGDAFNTVALVVLVFELTGSGAGVAGTVAFEVLPVLAFGPIAGMLVDRRSRRSVMIAADLACALVVASLALVGGSVALAFAVAFGVSAATVAFNPAASSLLPEVLTGLRSGRIPSARPSKGWAAVAAGVAAVRAVPLLRRLAVVQLLASLSAGATSGLLVVLASDALGVGPTGFGLLLAAIGVGAALGLYGTSTSTGMVAYQATLQTAVPGETRGRAFALYDVVWNAARLVSPRDRRHPGRGRRHPRCLRPRWRAPPGRQPGGTHHPEHAIT